MPTLKSSEIVASITISSLLGEVEVQQWSDSKFSINLLSINDGVSNSFSDVITAEDAELLAKFILKLIPLKVESKPLTAEDLEGLDIDEQAKLLDKNGRIF